MENTSEKYKAYLRIIKKELVPSMGCTEPIALAYCAALCKDVLGKEVSVNEIEKVNVFSSGNILKNVKSVIVPNSGNKKGIEVATAIGICGGKSENGLEVLAEITDEERKTTELFLKKVPVNIEVIKDEENLNIIVEIISAKGEAKVQIVKEHTNVVYIEKNGEPLKGELAKVIEKNTDSDYELLSIKDIYDFALSVKIEDVEEVISKQIEYNTQISKEGMKKNYGACIGKQLMEFSENNIKECAKAEAAAASEARMNGCDLPVVIVSGSGNQGIAASLPVIAYARSLGVPKEKLIRALIISDLFTLYQKKFIGRLSAFCGVVSAGAGASAAIAYLNDEEYDAVVQSLINTLGIVSGMVCDGAKSSCAAKMASAIDAGIMGYEMSKRGKSFYGGDGLIADDVENTIRNIGRLAKEGMYETDKEIMEMMLA